MFKGALSKTDFLKKIKADMVKLVIANKRTLKRVDTKIACEDLFDETKFPKESYLEVTNLTATDGKCMFDTYFTKYHELEEAIERYKHTVANDANLTKNVENTLALLKKSRRVEQSGVEAPAKSSGMVLVKGVLGEIYVRNKTTENTSERGDMVLPEECRTAVEIPADMKSFNIVPSYDPNVQMLVEPGDYVIISGDDFYSVYGPAFKKTYRVK